jgi:hypothetical protein
MLPALLGVLGPILGDVAKSLFPNPADELKRLELQQNIQLALLNNAAAIEQAAAANIKAEAESEHWLAANWRPLTMLTFVVLIVARWFGFAAPALQPEEYYKLWSIVELGLGGYVIGRSAEKIVPAVASALKK